MRDEGLQVNLPPYRPQPDAPAQLDQINFFGINYFFPSGNLSTLQNLHETMQRRKTIQYCKLMHSEN